MDTIDLRSQWIPGKRGPRGKAVYCIDANGNKIIFGSIKQAADYLKKGKPGEHRIGDALCYFHPTHHAYKYEWFYLDQDRRDSSAYPAPWFKQYGI